MHPNWSWPATRRRKGEQGESTEKMDGDCSWFFADGSAGDGGKIGQRSKRREEPAGKCGNGDEGDPGCAGQGAVRDCDAVGAEGGVYRRRELWTRRDGMPDGTRLYGTVGRAGDVSAGRRKHRIPDRRAGNGLRDSGDEQSRRGQPAGKQGEAGRRCFSGGGAERKDGFGGHGRIHAGGNAELFTGARSVRGDFAGRIDAAARRRGEQASVREGYVRGEDRSGNESECTCGGADAN